MESLPNLEPIGSSTTNGPPSTAVPSGWSSVKMLLQFLPITAATVIAGVLLFLRTDIGKQWMGIDAYHRTAESLELHATQILDQEHKLLVHDNQLNELVETVDAVKAALDTQQEGRAALIKRLDSLSEEINRVKKDFANFQKAQSDAVTTHDTKAVKPRTLAVPALSLVAIRMQAFDQMATVKSRSGETRFMITGDTWKGWTLLSANPSTGTAVFKVNGRKTEISL